jgi:hypothetical protein
MILPAKPRPARRSETRDLVKPIICALNRMPGVRVTRNASLGPVVPWNKRMDPAARPIIAGLGAGSADIVGIVHCSILYRTADESLDQDELRSWSYGRAFALEVKLPAHGGLRAGVLKSDQDRWLKAFRRFGGFAAVVRSVEAAVAAVSRCRTGASE